MRLCRANSEIDVCPYRCDPFYTAISRLNVQFAYKRQNTGTGKSHFLHFLEVARQDALTKWRPNHEPPCLRYCHTFYKVFAVQASCSGSNTIVTLTETLLCLRGGRQTEQHRSRPCSCSAGSHAPLSQRKKQLRSFLAGIEPGWQQQSGVCTAPRQVLSSSHIL